MRFFVTIADGFQPLAIVKKSLSYIWQSFWINSSFFIAFNLYFFNTYENNHDCLLVSSISKSSFRYQKPIIVYISRILYIYLHCLQENSLLLLAIIYLVQEMLLPGFFSENSHYNMSLKFRLAHCKFVPPPMKYNLYLLIFYLSTDVQE